LDHSLFLSWCTGAVASSTIGVLVADCGSLSLIDLGHVECVTAGRGEHLLLVLVLVLVSLG